MSMILALDNIKIAAVSYWVIKSGIFFSSFRYPFNFNLSEVIRKIIITDIQN